MICAALSDGRLVEWHPRCMQVLGYLDAPCVYGAPVCARHCESLLHVIVAVIAVGIVVVCWLWLLGGRGLLRLLSRAQATCRPH